MTGQAFSGPVVVCTRAGRRIVSRVDEAAEILLYEVPGMAQGDHLVRTAMKACHDVLQGRGELENARTIFEAAMREVGLLAD
ncbi:DUF982 domain-containing protein [Microvirga brassicacearum]|uniref:DUF982 domain-containing protein n=1 Tax=Microvirga brassicacearum TaxID=2580413 RepID=A0A5N3PDS2_9HYPH|nr:DUF982 domain-containing protein [Microvirga brassicacearum]KAB0267861.1 DUF982 domain-containing protein [Microvirga brassicacearum]